MQTKNKMESINKKIVKIEGLFSTAEMKATAIFLDLIPYISDYDENTYDRWAIVDTTDGLCLTDGDGLNASLTNITYKISVEGSIDMNGLYSCGI